MSCTNSYEFKNMNPSVYKNKIKTKNIIQVYTYTSTITASNASF